MKLSFPRLSLAIVASAALVLPQLSSPAMDVMERIVTTQTQAIRYEATEYQRKVAEANARAYMAAHRTKQATKPEKTASTTPKPKKEKDVAQETHPAKTKLPRYVAVETVKDKRAAPGTKKVVMIWDTQSEALVNNNVYDVQSVPAVGSTAKFDTFSAQYVGNGQ